MDIDFRLLRYFAVVAELGNLTEAARRLHVSQPALTKQIRRLEDRLGARLFDRSPAGMTPTAAGRALAERVPGLLADWDAALRRTRAAAAEAERVLRVGFLASAANEATETILAEFAERRPDWRVELRQSSWADPSAGLARAEVDVALLRLPVPGQERLRVEELFTEPRWVVLPVGHRLTERDDLDVADLESEPFVAAPAATGAWREHWLGAEDANRPRRIGAVTEHPDEWLAAIAGGQGIGLAPESARRYYARPGIVYRPVTGVTPSRVAVAWARDRDANPAMRDFVGCCLAHRDRSRQ